MKNTAQLLAENKAWIDETYEKMEKKLRAMAVRSRDVVAYGVDENGLHRDMKEGRISWWTNGFWGGLNYLLYEYTKNPDYLETAKNIDLPEEAGKLVKAKEYRYGSTKVLMYKRGED